MGYGRYNKAYEFTPRFMDLVPASPVELEPEAPEYIERREPMDPPGVHKSWVKAIEEARRKYPPVHPDYHQVVQDRVKQKGLRVPFILLRANLGDGSQALEIAKSLDNNNPARSMISFLGNGVLSPYVKVEAVGVAVNAAMTFSDAEHASELDAAYSTWQQQTGQTEVAILSDTEYNNR